MEYINKIKEMLNNILSFFSDDENEIYYLSNNEKLPNVLSEEEEKELLIRLENKDQEARNILVEKNLRLVVYIAKKFENSGVNIEDLISIGTIGLVKGVNSYKMDKNIKLATYASRCIENEILMFLRKSNRTKAEVSIDEPINIDSEGNDLLLSDILGSDIDNVYNQVEEKDNRKVLYSAIMELNDRDKLIMEMRYGFDGKEELTQKEVADKLGISQSYISRIEKKVINNLKKNFLK